MGELLAGDKEFSLAGVMSSGAVAFERSISRIVSVCSPQLIAFETIFNREY